MGDTVLHYGDLLYLETQAHFHLRDTPCLRLPLCDLVLASVEACESLPAYPSYTVSRWISSAAKADVGEDPCDLC